MTLLFRNDEQTDAIAMIRAGGFRVTRAEVPGVVTRFVHPRNGVWDLISYGPAVLAFVPYKKPNPSEGGARPGTAWRSDP